MLALASPSTLAAAGDTSELPVWSHALGVEVNLEEIGALADELRRAEAAGNGLLVHTDLDLEALYSQDPSLQSLWKVLRPLVKNGLQPVLTLQFHGRALPGPEEEERLDAWVSGLEGLAGLGGHMLAAVALQLPENLDAAGRTPAEVAFFVKRSGVALRTVRRDLPILLDLPEPVGDWLRPLLAEDVGPYIDGVILQAPDPADEEWVERQSDTLLDLRPGLRLLTRGWPVHDPAQVLEVYLRAVGAGAAAVLFDRRDAVGDAFLWSLLGRLREKIPDRMPPAPPATVRFLGPDGREVAAVHGHFFDSERFDGVIWYRSSAREAPDKVEVILGTADAAAPLVINPVSGDEHWVTLWVPDRRARTTRFDVPFGEDLLLLHYERQISAAGERDDLQVVTERVPPVEEILARHQEFQAAQDARQKRWIADATIALHYSIGASGTLFDLTYESTVYADPEGSTEWEHRRLLFNGTPYRSKKLPDLPYVLPERVVEVPLRLTLDKDYQYRLIGRDKVGGASAWKVEFAPLDPKRNLYRGRVWIDTETFARLRLSAVQTVVESPVLSLEEDLRFEALERPGAPLWVLKRSRGQQVITVSGRNLVLVREIEFDNFQINPEDFEQQRQRALASPHFIVRETEDGYQTLERRKDGTRVPRPSGARRTLFLLGGIFYNESVSVPVPLAGINYFNFEAGGRDLHLEIFATGALNFVNLTDPKFLDSKWEVGADLLTRAFPITDRYLRTDAEGEEIEEFGVDDITQRLSLIGGRPLGSFFKLTTLYDLEYIRYSRDEDTPSAFVTPPDTFVHNVEAKLEFNRQATSVRIFGRYSRRTSWGPWGFPSAALSGVGSGADPATGFGAGTLLEDFDPDAKDYLQYGFSASRLWSPTLLQTLRAEVSWFQGEDLDRFSKFAFSTLGDVRVRGFGGSGVRFDQGGIARAVYTFGLGNALRLDVSLDHARVRERDPGERKFVPGRDLGAGEFLDFTGLGVAGNFTLPGGWIVRLDYGIGLFSDLEEPEGEQEIFLQLLRIL